MPRSPRLSFARLFRRRTRGGPDAGGRPSSDARRQTMQHLRDFIDTRQGVEAYVEPPTAQIPATILLVATTGEWTRRRVPDEKTAFDLAGELGVPVYNVRFIGYPQRMRDWTSAQRRK
ncbi:oxidoreductase [Myceligenerans indicum]|uniref:Oxidoreductase n=1 Tax=Myceligenerans indicum TaxID=2593663 RepID=A0ABS1LK62_9MICO|nr:oxidoreductase [Myceligenerans indicum]MBL0886617.1 oxidoreductase [Myceligenerans indicum]